MKTLVYVFALLSIANTCLASPVISVDTRAGKKSTGYLGLGEAVYAEERLNAIPLPDSFDWNEKGMVTPIRDQGQCGSCWSFAITKSLESALMIQSGKSMSNLSEQQMVSCARDAYGCGGGFMSSAKFVVNPGLTDEASFPYAARNLRCKTGLKIKEKAVKYELLGSPTKSPTVEEIKIALLTFGPLYVTVAAGGSGWSGRTGEITGCRNRGTNHMVVITGYTADDKWIVANSWGSNWGNKGYTLMKFGCDKIAEDAGYVITQPIE